MLNPKTPLNIGPKGLFNLTVFLISILLTFCYADI